MRFGPRIPWRMNILLSGEQQIMKGLRNREVTVIGITIVLCCFWNSSAQAIRIGSQSQINPFFEIQETYDSNIFSASDNSSYKESDYLTVLSPGIHLQIPATEKARYQLSSNYRANFKYYGAYGDDVLDPDEELNAIEHRFDIQARVNFVSGLNFGAGYVLNRSSIAPDFPGDPREDHQTQSISARAGYQFIDRYEIQVDYASSFPKFEESDTQGHDDYRTHNVDITLFYRLFPTVSILGGGGYGMTDREEPFFSDSTDYRVFSGVRFDTTERLTGSVRAGYTARSYEADDIDDATTLFFNGELGYRLFSQTQLAFQAQRTITESTRLNASAGEGAYVLVTRLGMSLNHQLAMLPNMSLSGSLATQWSSYPEDEDEKRSDTLVEAGAGVAYKLLKYLSLGANYSHRENDSNIAEKNYRGDSATFFLRLLL